MGSFEFTTLFLLIGLWNRRTSGQNQFLISTSYFHSQHWSSILKEYGKGNTDTQVLHCKILPLPLFISQLIKV